MTVYGLPLMQSNIGVKSVPRLVVQVVSKVLRVVSDYCTVYRVGNSSLLGHCPFGLDVNLIFKGTEASWEGTKATFHPSPGAPRPV